jgi:O-antigen/teichoic acid export membrane protein
LITTALAAATLAALVVGGIFAVVGSLISVDFEPLASPWPLLLFATGTGLTAAGLVLDQSLIGLLRGGLQIARYVLFGVGKLLALALLAISIPTHDGMIICASWVAGIVLSLVPLARLGSKQGPVSMSAYIPDWSLLRGHGRTALSHHLLNTALQFPYLMLPVLVTAVLSSTDNAYFYAAWMIASMLFLICGALTAVLYAVGARNPEALTGYTRLTLGLGVGCALVAGVVLVPLGTPILNVLFGAEYAAQASPALRMLILGAFPLAIVDHYVALCRVRRRTLNASRLVIAGGLLQLVLAALGAHTGGLEALSLGWVLGLCATAVCMLPLVYRTVRGAPAHHTAIIRQHS